MHFETILEGGLWLEAETVIARKALIFHFWLYDYPITSFYKLPCLCNLPAVGSCQALFSKDWSADRCLTLSTY